MISLVLFVVIGSMFGVVSCGDQSSDYEPPASGETEGAVPEEEPQRVEEQVGEIDAIPVEQFLKEYYSLDSDFSVGEIIRVRGMVKEVIIYGSVVVVRLEQDYKKHRLNCAFTKNSETEKAKTLRKGQEVVIEGELDRYRPTISTRLMNSILLNW